MVIYFLFFVGVNLLIGTDSGLYLLDRSGDDKGRHVFIFISVHVPTDLPEHIYVYKRTHPT